MRVDGQLVPIPGEPVLDQDDVESIVLGVLTDDLESELRTEPRGRLLVLLQQVARFRVNCFFQMGALAMSLRMIPLKLPTFDELGLPPAVEYFANLPQGLVLVTGPTGSGKSTTLAAIIDYINTQPAAATSSRSRTRSSTCTAQVVGGEPARGRQRHALVRPGAARGARARTPT